MILDGIFHDNKDQVDEYNEALLEILVSKDDVRCVPELYAVPSDKVSIVFGVGNSDVVERPAADHFTGVSS